MSLTHVMIICDEYSELCMFYRPSSTCHSALHRNSCPSGSSEHSSTCSRYAHCFGLRRRSSFVMMSCGNSSSILVLRFLSFGCLSMNRVVGSSACSETRLRVAGLRGLGILRISTLLLCLIANGNFYCSTFISEASATFIIACVSLPFAPLVSHAIFFSTNFQILFAWV